MVREFRHAEYGVIRVTIIKNQPYFCLVDLGRILDIQNVTNCRTKIPAEEIISVKVKKAKNCRSKLFISAKQISTCIFQSKKVEAEEINDWLLRIVLPEVIKYRNYNIDEYNDPNKLIKFLDEYQELLVKNRILETDIKLNKPKLIYINKLLGTKNWVDLDSVHSVIKYKGIKNMELLKILRAVHVLDENNIPYQEYCDRKYFRVVEAKAVTCGSVITTVRTFVYKSGITFIEKILTEFEVSTNAKKDRKLLYTK